MADERKKPASVPTTTSAGPAPDAEGPIDPHEDPGAYLRGKGWKPLGLIDHPSTLWLQPNKPLIGHYTEEPVMRRLSPDGDIEQLMGQTGEQNKKKLIFQKVWHPPAEPMTLQQALREQMEQDYREQTRQAQEQARQQQRELAKR